MPNNHSQYLDIYTKTKEQAVWIQKLLQSEGTDIDFNKVIQCKCYVCSDGKVVLSKECEKEMHMSCKKCDKAFKDAGIERDEWYTAHIDVWDTKWNACEVQPPDLTQPNEDNYYSWNLTYNFWTAWSPPIAIYNRLAEIVWKEFGKDVFIEVVCHDEFVWQSDEEVKNSERATSDAVFKVNKDELLYWNSIDKELKVAPDNIYDEFHGENTKEARQMFNLFEFMDEHGTEVGKEDSPLDAFKDNGDDNKK